MRRRQSIRLRVQAVVGILVAVLVLACAAFAHDAFQQRNLAERVLSATTVMRDLFVAMNALRLERGEGDAIAIEPGGPAPAPRVALLMRLRTRSDTALAPALKEMDAFAPTGDTFLQTEIRARVADLEAARAALDAGIRLPTDRRPTGLDTQWMDSATGLTDTLTRTTGRLSAEVARLNTESARLTRISQLAWATRAAAGTDSLLWGRAALFDKPLTPAQQREFDALADRVDTLWGIVREEVEQTTSQPLAQAVAEADQAYFGRDRAMRQRLLADVNAARPAPGRPEQASFDTPGLTSLMNVSRIAADEAMVLASRQAAAAARRLTAALAVMALAIGGGLAAVLFVSGHVLGPLSRITRAMGLVAGGDLDRPIPDVDRPDEIGDLARALGVFQENARAKLEADQALLASRIAQQAAESAAAAKAQFLANMSHEIRTPLTAVIGFAGLLAKSEGLSDKAMNHVRRIVDGGRALLALVNDILDLSRIEAGRIDLDPQPTALAPFLGEVVELMRPQAERKGLSLMLVVGGDLPETASIDAERVRRVLTNLLANAVKFTDQGQVTVEANGADGRLLVRVCDTGVGIGPEDRQRLFERFTQVDESNSRRFGGAGLGLAIARGLVEAMGGELGVESVLGVGSTFWFAVPAPVAGGVSAAETTEAEAPLGALKILVVDDVGSNRELIIAMLSRPGLQLSEAANGAEAVEAARRSPFDLILMDLQMPVMDGFAAARAIRAGSINARTPILAVSADVMAPHIEACRAAGMDDHVAEPINPGDLLARIDHWTGVAQA